jgi:hypothetical protein
MTTPTFQSPTQPPARSAGRPPHTTATSRRECADCGWPVDLSDGQYVPPHNQWVMSKGGPKFSGQPCDGGRRPPADAA